MGVLDLEKIEAWGADLLAKIEEEKAVKLANREKIVAERVAEFERKLRETIDDELVAEVNAKYAHDIELFERFRKDEVAGEEVLEENTEIEGE